MMGCIVIEIDNFKENRRLLCGIPDEIYTDI